MPDGDRVYGGLTQEYEKPYEQVCEGHFSFEEIAHNLLAAVRGDIRRNGPAPIELLRQVADHLNQLPHEPLLKPTINWEQESRDIERLARQIHGPRRAIDIALDASKKYLRTFQYGHDKQEHDRMLLQGYMERVYEANFEGRVPLGNHPYGVDQAAIDERLEAIRPFVLAGLASFARQAARRGDFSRLQRTSPSRIVIDADTDLLALS